MAIASARGKLIGVIGDEDTCVGFLLGGIGKLLNNKTKIMCLIFVNYICFKHR